METANIKQKDKLPGLVPDPEKIPGLFCVLFRRNPHRNTEPHARGRWARPCGGSRNPASNSNFSAIFGWKRFPATQSLASMENPGHPVPGIRMPELSGGMENNPVTSADAAGTSAHGPL
jgi:hypothetical protein